MNILFHAHEFNLKEGGPCTKRINSFANYLTEQGHRVTIITSSHNKSTESKENTKNKEYQIVYAYSTKKMKKSTIHRLLNNFLFGLTSFFKALIKTKKVDVVVTTSPPPLISIFGYWIAKIKKAKLVYDVRDIWPDVAIEMESFKKGSFYDKVFSVIAKFMYKHSDIITTVTPGKVTKIEKYVDNAKKVKYIPNGYDENLTKFEIDMKLVEKYHLKDKFTIVYIGNVGLAQNLDALVNLAQNNKNNSNMQFLVFGEGAYKKQLEDKIKQLDLNNISLEGKIDYSKVHTILKYSRISFISLKNTKMTDSVPTKMFDALGVGCPVLLLAKGDSCDILREAMLGESAENIEELNEKFDSMIENYKDYEKNKQKAIQYVIKYYSRKEIAKNIERELIKLC